MALRVLSVPESTTTPAPGRTLRVVAEPTAAPNPIRQGVRALSSLSLGLPSAINRGVQSEMVRLGQAAQRVPTFQSVAQPVGDIVRRLLRVLSLPTGITAGFLPFTKAGAVARGIEAQTQNVGLAGLADELALSAGVGAIRGTARGLASRAGTMTRTGPPPKALPAPRPTGPRPVEMVRSTRTGIFEAAPPRGFKRGAAPLPTPGEMVRFNNALHRVVSVDPTTQQVVLALTGGKTITAALGQVQPANAPAESPSFSRGAQPRAAVARARQQALQQPFQRSIDAYEQQFGAGTFDKLSPRAQLKIIENAPEAAPVRDIIRRVTGQTKTGTPIAEAAALKRLFAREAAAATQAYRQGKIAGGEAARAPTPLTPKQQIQQSTGLAPQAPTVSEAAALKASLQRQQTAATAGARAARVQLVQHLAAMYRDPRTFIKVAQQKHLTPTQIGRVAKLYRQQPQTPTAPLTRADLKAATTATRQIRSPEGQPTGTPPRIPTSKALIISNVPRPVRDLTEPQAVPFSGLDPSRAAQIIDASPSGPTQQRVLTPLRRSELAMRQEQQRTLHTLRQVSGNLKEGSDESRMVFEFLEGRLPSASMTPRARATAQWMAQQFDQLLERVNAARSSIGKRPIQRRTGYITHLQDASLWDAMREAFTNAPDEATKTLQSAFFEHLKARGPGFRFGLPRLGGPHATDALRAFKAYLPAALRVVHLSAPSRMAIVYLNRSLAGTPNAHRYFSQLVRQVATGQQGPLAKLLPRPLVRATNWLKGRFGKGTILGNLSSVLQQPFTLPATVAQTGMDASLGAAGWLARGDGLAFAMQWSPTLQARVMEMDVDFTRLASKWDAAMGSLFAAADRTMVAHAFTAGYLRAIQEGQTFEQAIQAGEQTAIRTQSSFLTSDMAPVFRDSIGAGFLQFQNTINGVFNFLVHDIPKGWAGNRLHAAAEFVGTFAAMAALYEALGLPHPDEISDFVPGLSTMRSGGPVGIRLAVALFHLGSPDARKRAEAVHALQSTGFALAFGAGGNQLSKSFRGFKAVVVGGKYDKAGRLQFPVRGLPEQGRAVAFGPYGTKAGRAYIERGFKAEPQSAVDKMVDRKIQSMERKFRVVR